MKTKKTFLITILLFSMLSFAQQFNTDIKALKVAFISTELGLTTDEATKFWPIYNAYDDKQFEIRQKRMELFMNKLSDGVIGKMNEREASYILYQMESNENELSELRKKFNFNIRRILAPTKILKLKKAEEDFKKKLLQQYKNKGPR